MNRATQRRRAVSLLELLVVVSLMAIVSSIVMIRHGRSMLANTGAQGECRRLWLNLLQMQRRAITSGIYHGIVFTSSGGEITGYRVVSNLELVSGQLTTGDNTTDVDASRSFTTDVTVTVSHSVMGYQFEGQAGGAYRVVLAGPQREFTIDAIPITGAVNTSDRYL